MKPNTPLDYAVFQLSPKRSHCELFVSSKGNTEKLASGLLKPFVTHLKVAEEQVAQAVHSIKLEVERHRNGGIWFTKGTLERFVRFVSTPEILEMVNTLDAEMSQLEAARKIYSQGADDQLSGALGGDGTGSMAAADATKKELLRAIDVRLATVRQDLTAACNRASAAGFNPHTVSELQLFADRFGAYRLNDACTKFSSLSQRRLDLINHWKPAVEDQVVRSSWESDMSIDDPNEESSGSHDIKTCQPKLQNKLQHQQAGQEQEQHLNQPKPTTSQPDSSHNIHNENREAEKKKEDAASESSSGQTTQHARRLSVQDRINLFENKQKENSGGKPIAVGKSAELRRLSSDVSSAPAAEKAVLRRWSGASDMSIDLGNDKKENNNIDSPLCTPSSSSLSQSKSNLFPGSSEDNKDGLEDTTSSVKVEAKTASGLRDQGEQKASSGGFVGKDEEMGLKGRGNLKAQVGSQPQVRSFASRGEQAARDDLGAREEKLKITLGRVDRSGVVKDQVDFEGKSGGFPDRVGTFSQKKQVSLQSQIGSPSSKVGDLDTGNRIEDVEVREQLLNQSQFRGSQTHTRSLSGQFEGSFGVKVKEVPQKEIEGSHPASQQQFRSFTGEIEQEGKKDTVLSGKNPIKVEDLEVPRMKVQKPVSAGPEQNRKLHTKKDESGSVYESTKPVFLNKKASESQESRGGAQPPSVEQVQRVRQSKGNQELNDELKMKANELEKLFAEHKLRVPGDQSGSARRKPTEMQVGLEVNSLNIRPAAAGVSPVQFQDQKTVVEPTGSTSDLAMFSTPPMKMVDHHDYGSSLRQNFSDLSFSDDSRGKFYEKYMQKRDAKLKEEWGKKRAEKEAKLKSMHDSLERSRAEMKAKFSGSADRQDSVSSAHRRAEKLRMLNFHSSVKIEQQPLDSTHSEEDEDLPEFPEPQYYGQEIPLNDASLGDGASRSSQSKKILPNRNLSSTTPRTTAIPAPRSSSKISVPISGRRRMQSENPLAQSVPNFSDFRKENTKPTSGVSKTANRSQVRTYARSKSTNEDLPLSKEEKARRSQSLKKSSATFVEFKDSTLLSTESVGLTPLKFDKEQVDQSLHNKISRNIEPKSFLRKGNGIGPGAAGSVSKFKASVASDIMKDEEEFEESTFDAEDSVPLKEEEEDDLETMGVEDCANMDNGQPRHSQDSDKIGMSGSENGDSLRSLSQIDPSSVAGLPTSVPSAFPVGSLQDSPGESPVSWNSRMHHPFSYLHETSDIDASVDSPIGSPASWNSHSLAQTDADAARMRKKWGSAQKPIFAANPSHSQSRKDMTKGFKRLLKFGRRNRGADTLVDWISATTSEGDDDTEDARDPANRSSEDLRKSRMGFSQGHPADDGFNESEMFNEQVALHSSIPAPPANFKLRDDHMSGSSIKAPRSFFSLSSFRSKGSDSKPR